MPWGSAFMLRPRRGRWEPGAAASANNKVAACAHYVRSGERGTEAAPATSEALYARADLVDGLTRLEDSR